MGAATGDRLSARRRQAAPKLLLLLLPKRLYFRFIARRYNRRKRVLKMIEHVSSRLLGDLFGGSMPADDEIVITRPLSIDPALEAVAIGFVGSVYVVFFAEVLAYAAGDEDFLRETAAAWNNGFVPAANARLVKFLRADAERDTMFLPHMWPLPQPALIWQFSEALADALALHSQAMKDVSQYFYTPQTPKLDALYNRLARKFERGLSGVEFRCVTRPQSDQGGFYGFERV